jgi:hypothetical protein
MADSPREDHGPVLGSGFVHLAAIALLGFGIVFVWASWSNRMMRQPALIVLAVCALPGAITLFRLWRLRKAIGTADLHIDDPITLGFSGKATYVRPLHEATLRQIEARVQCEEVVVKGSGKNKREIRAVVHDEALTPATVPMMEQIQAQIPIRIPPTGPASFSEEEARVVWWIRLRLRMEGCPNTESSFQIEVLPAVAER